MQVTRDFDNRNRLRVEWTGLGHRLNHKLGHRSGPVQGLALGIVFGLIVSVAGLQPASAAEIAPGSVNRNQQPPTQAATDPALAPSTPVLIADLLGAHKQYADAIKAYQKIEPKTAYIYNQIGIDEERQSIDADAIVAYHWAIRMDRRYAPAYNNLGTVYFHDGDKRGALHMYKTAIRLDAKNASYWSNLGALYLSKKDYRDGIEAYQRAYGLNSGIFDEIALNGIRQNESPEDVAIEDLCFAEVYAQAGMKSAAIEYLRKSLLAGLRDPHRIAEDTQLASLHGMPEFEQLLKKPATR